MAGSGRFTRVDVSDDCDERVRRGFRTLGRSREVVRTDDVNVGLFFSHFETKKLCEGDLQGIKGHQRLIKAPIERIGAGIDTYQGRGRV